MAAQPGYRSNRAMLRRLSHTSACFDLSRGRCRPVGVGKLALALSERIARDHRGRQREATGAAVAAVVSALGIAGHDDWSPGERRTLHEMAPLLGALPELTTWSRRDKQALADAIRAKGDQSELRGARLLAAHPRLATALHTLAGA